MNKGVIYELERLEQDLKEIQNTCDSARTYTAGAWKGDASQEYLNYLNNVGERALFSASKVNDLTGQVSAFIKKMEAEASVV